MVLAPTSPAATQPPGRGLKGSIVPSVKIVERTLMSALGQKRTHAPQKIMSTLHPKATLDAYFLLCDTGAECVGCE
jgi:hypothetical protein